MWGMNFDRATKRWYWRDWEPSPWWRFLFYVDCVSSPRRSEDCHTSAGEPRVGIITIAPKFTSIVNSTSTNGMKNEWMIRGSGSTCDCPSEIPEKGDVSWPSRGKPIQWPNFLYHVMILQTRKSSFLVDLERHRQLANWPSAAAQVKPNFTHPTRGA